MEKQEAPTAREGEAALREYLNNPQHWNRYPYALNNPLKYIDPTGEAEKIVVNLNIVWDKEKFKNEEEARKAVASQVADLQQVYGAIDIEFNVTYTKGSAENLSNANKARVVEGVVEGALNVFVSNRGGMDPQFSHTRTGVSYLNVYEINNPLRLFTSVALAHEVAHQFGVGSSGVISNIISDAELGLANMQLRRRGATEGSEWVDDYRNATQYYALPHVGAPPVRIKRIPTTLDIYRVGARRFTGKN